MVNSTEGANAILSYEMNHFGIYSLAQFCFFPKGSYNLLFHYLDLDNSTCCVCKDTDCEDCNNTKWTISIIDISVTETYRFILHIKNVSLLDCGIYTMTACVYQVDNKSCGLPAWTKLDVYPPSDDKRVAFDWKKWGLDCILPSTAVFVAVVVSLVLLFYYCCIYKG